MLLPPVLLSVVLSVATSSSFISTYAGTGNTGSTGDYGLATSATLNAPVAVAVDSSGNVYIVDVNNNKIRKVTGSTGIITPFAGSGNLGSAGDGGPATLAGLKYPYGLAVDSSGDVYIADTDNNKIRKVTGSTSIITTIAGTGSAGTATAVNGDGGAATSALLKAPRGVAVDSSGNVYIADTSNNKVRKVSAGIITTIAGTGGLVTRGDNGAATSAGVREPYSVSVHTGGDVYIADYVYNKVRKVAFSTSIITTIAGTGSTGSSGDGGHATSALLNSPYAATVDRASVVYIADTNNNKVRVVKNTSPTSGPSSSPSSEPSSQPTNPTGRPSKQPSRPSSQPTSNPTFEAQSTGDKTTYITSTASVKMSNTTFANLGHSSTVYLSAFLLNSFLSSTSRAHVAVTVYPDSRMQSGSALAVTNASCCTAAACLSAAGLECATNYEISPLTRSSRYGGSVFVVAYIDLRSFEGAKSYCTVGGSSDVQFTMALTISLGHGQPTASPTELPTLAPSKSSSVSTVNTAQTAPTTVVDLNNIQYYFIVIFFAAYVGVGFLVVRAREMDDTLVKLELRKVSVMMAVQGVSLISELFYVSVLFSSGSSSYTACAAVMLSARLCHTIPTAYVLANIFEPYGVKGIYSSSVDKPSVFAGDALYGVIVLISMLEFQLCILLPWRSNVFSEMSFGYPNYSIFRTGIYIKSAQTVISTIIQIYFIATDTNQTDSAMAFNAINLAITLINLLMTLAKGFLKMNILHRYNTPEYLSPKHPDRPSHKASFEMAHIKGMAIGEDGGVPFTVNPLRPIVDMLRFSTTKKGDIDEQGRISKLESKIVELEELLTGVESRLSSLESNSTFATNT